MFHTLGHNLIRVTANKFVANKNITKCPCSLCNMLKIEYDIKEAIYLTSGKCEMFSK